MRLSSIPSYSPIALLRSKTHFTGGGPGSWLPFPSWPHSISLPLRSSQSRPSGGHLIVINSPPTHTHTCSQALRVSKPFVPGDLFLPGPIRSWLTFYLCGCWFLVSCASSIFLTPKHTEEAKSTRSSAPLLHLSKGHTEAGSHRFQVTLQPDPGLPLPLLCFQSVQPLDSRLQHTTAW